MYAHQCDTDQLARQCVCFRRVAVPRAAPPPPDLRLLSQNLSFLSTSAPVVSFRGDPSVSRRDAGELWVLHG
jgi:hypothetical protein